MTPFLRAGSKTRMPGLSVAALLALLCVTVVVSSAAGKTAPSGEVADVSIYLPSPTNPKNELSLEVFPAEGVAVARTSYGSRFEPTSGAYYAAAIPAAPFDGSLDLNFLGLGQVVGTVTPTEVRGETAEAMLCEESYPSESATFKGRIAFHGAGDPRRWKAKKAEASIDPSCGARLERRNGPSSLFHHLGGFGPNFSGDFIGLFANGETKKRRTQFVAVGDSRGNRSLQLLAFDEEWLPGEIATQRWVKRYASFDKVMDFAQDDDEPSRVTVAPPAPFSGRATYLKRTGKVTGSLGVHFPGLKVRLARPPAEAIFEDEEPGSP
jgi:hypothetical protein